MAGNEIDHFKTDGYNHGNDGPVHEINVNEHIIGVYGIKENTDRWFKGFGFIVRT